LAGGARRWIGETGTGCGVGLAWLASGARDGVRLCSVERDPGRAAVAAGVFAGHPDVEILHGDWRRIEERGPYDLLVLDGGGQGKREDDDPADPARLLTPGGTVVVDDFTPATSYPPLHEGRPDHARLHWLKHSALRTVELALAEDLATLVGTRRRLAGTETTWRGMERGQVLRGVVKGIERFGVFVGLDGGVEGFVDIIEISWRRFSSPHEVVRVGQEISAEVLAFDLDREQVRLSIKALEPDPLAEFARDGIGRMVRGRVTLVVPFGVFVEVTDGIDGLVHKDALAGPFPAAAPEAGDELTVEVVGINVILRRVALRPC
jgi:predicted RNA-binding protein with RPS1 domain